MGNSTTVRSILIDRDNRVLFLENGQGESMNHGLWNLPGGHITNGNTSLETIMSSIETDTGIADFRGLEYLKTVGRTDYYVKRVDESAPDIDLDSRYSRFEWIEIDNFKGDNSTGLLFAYDNGKFVTDNYDNLVSFR